MTELYNAFRLVASKHPQTWAIIGGNIRHRYAQALMRVRELEVHLDGEARAAALIIGAKSADTVLWQLACNKAGKVFIPCDSATPVARVADIVQRTRPRWILSNDNRDFSEAGYVERSQEGLFKVWTKPDFAVYPEDVSHIIFSSGSTGAPKAILLPDAPVVAVVRAQADMLGLGPGSRFAWLLSPAFDASLSDIYSTLLSGGELHVCNFSMRSVKTLQAYFRQHRITHSDLSPSLLPLLAPAAMPDLCALIFGGELAKESIVFDWVGQGKRLFNAYGPTEATICTSLREVQDGWSATNIGKPLPGASYWLLEGEQFREGRPGDKGELYIGGAHLALGFDNAELTAARFLNHNGTRYYKSGDIVEVDATGDYHFKGRVDRQLKYHGVLICPEEIEAHALHAGCSEALLRLEDKKLVLYYAGAVPEETVKSVLKAHLSPHAHPHRYCQMEALPKSIAGKIQL